MDPSGFAGSGSAELKVGSDLEMRIRNTDNETIIQNVEIFLSFFNALKSK